ncbi:RNA polymerase sigma factor [Chthonobacter rhizosphaerae]|uniref:RNA polymerase sigma factor n=1 Tax=Chthonobacter rhizosphaerae TaxID=2735553 RepID=UPI0015EE659A|nr:DUF6596 domain-containing protein [Chthonobacter rhizosphaerae]
MTSHPDAHGAPFADEAARAAERAARLSYGRLLAHLARAFRDVTAAEDALGDAFAAALRSWPRQGVPANPDGWLTAAARNRLIDLARSGAVRAEAASTLDLMARAGENGDGPPLADRRLGLLFVCAHPAIDPAARTPLMLQTVLGFDARRIAAAFLVAPAAMSQRLVRAKARIRDTGLRFDLPDAGAWPARADSVREAIFAAYGAGWDAAVLAGGGDRDGLTEEAIWLARVLVDGVPDDAEARGLLALMLFCEARSGARRTPEGAYVPLAAQDPARWSRPMIVEAEEQLSVAARSRSPGRFQLEAAIQSAHVAARVTGRDLSAALVHLHEQLAAIAPTIGSVLGLAAALGAAGRPSDGLALADGLPASRVADHQPFHAVRAHLLEALGRGLDAAEARARAAALADDPAVRAFLTRTP